MSDIEQMLFNELSRIEKSLEIKERRLASLLDRKIKTSVRGSVKPKANGIEFDFVPGELIRQQKSFIVDSNVIFRPSKVEHTLKISGFDDVGNTNLKTIVIPFNDPTISAGRNGFFDFQWEIKDSGSDREWQSDPQPSSFMMSGAIFGFYFGMRGVLAQGTEVFIDIIPILSATTATFNGIRSHFQGTITKYTIAVFMSGHEEILS